MSTEGASQPPTGSDKARAPKGPISTAAFIDKGSKKFAPKLVRRRPGASAAVPSPRPPELAATAPESQPAQTQTPDETNIIPASEPQTKAQQSPPAATQQVASKKAQHTTTLAESSAPVVEPTPKPTVTPADNAVVLQQEKAIETTPSRAPTNLIELPRSAEEELETNLPSRPQRIEAHEEVEKSQDEPPTTPSEPVPAGKSAPATESAPTEPESVIVSLPKQSSNDGSRATTTASNATNETGVEVPGPIHEGEVAVTRTPEAQAPGTPTRPKRRRLPWAAVNAPRDGNVDPGPTATTLQAKAKRKRKAITLREIDEEDEREAEEAEETQSRPIRPSTKAQGKRKARELVIGDDAARPAKKARKAKEDKGKKRAAAEGEENDGGEPVEGEEARSRKKRKKKGPNTEPAEGANEGNQGEQQPARKGRPPREATPSDAEDEVIDTGVITMNSIASRNIRVGKLSEREKKMRTINWEEEKKRKREKEMNQSASDIQAEANRQLQARTEAAEAALDPNRLRYVEVDGVITQMAGTGIIDQEAQAARDRAGMVIVDEDDLTNQVNYRSFMRNNKRFPNEFLLPGQGKRWNFKDTEDFYAALAMFGTDFQMIATLFPTVTRRSVKKKFTREERRNPQRVKETLHGQVNSDWDQYLASSGRKDDSFVDVETIERQLREEREEAEVQIQKAREAAEEERRQRRLAGVGSEDEAAGDKENGKAKGKKGKKAAKQVAFELQEGEEILGAIDEDDGWGVE